MKVLGWRLQTFLFLLRRELIGSGPCVVHNLYDYSALHYIGLCGISRHTGSLFGTSERL